MRMDVGGGTRIPYGVMADGFMADGGPSPGVMFSQIVIDSVTIFR